MIDTDGMPLHDWVCLNKIEAALSLRDGALSRPEESTIRNTLAERLAAWTPPPLGRKVSDEAVRALLQGALDETARTHIACPGAPTLCGMAPGPGVLAYDFCSLTEDASAWCPECWKEAHEEGVRQPSTFAGLPLRDVLTEAEALLHPLMYAPADLDWRVEWGPLTCGAGPWVTHGELVICDLRRDGDGKPPSPGALLSDDLDALLLASSSKLLGVARRLVEEVKRLRKAT